MRHRERFDDGWIFHLGELEHPPVRRTFKAGACGGVSDCVDGERGALQSPGGLNPIAAVLPAFAPALKHARTIDKDWAPVRLPHDWRIGQDYVASGSDGYPHDWQGSLPAGVGYYRKTFRVPSDWDGGRVFIEFEGVMRSSTVWVNGHLIGEHGSGYTGFSYDIADVLRYGDEGDNVTLVRCDASEAEGWWGEGAGIYRHVWLTSCSPLHFAPAGVWVRAEVIGSARATIVVEAVVANATAEAVDVEVVAWVADPRGRAVGTVHTQRDCDSGSTVTVRQELEVAEPLRWDVDSPQLYTVVTELVRAGEVIDKLETAFGIRTCEFTPDDGFHLNGRRVQLWGANIHQDFAGLGIGLPDRIIEHKLELVQEMGCNAVRSAHHPPTPHLLDVCDRLGLLVIDENRHLESTADGLADFDALILRDRNHPCVIAWCLENEEFLEGTPTGTRTLQTLQTRARTLDPTRPTMVAGCYGMDSAPYYGTVDVVGYNYGSLNGTMIRHRAEYAGRAMVATEDGLHPSTRGVFADHAPSGRLSEYGTRVPPFDRPDRLGPEAVWQFHLENPQFAGAFVWSGFDYRGEPFPLGWPCIASHYGAMDSCGFPKSYYWLLRSFFRTEPVLHVLPHWTWPGREDELIEVWAYTNCDEVELTLNGEPVGRRSVQMHKATWSVGYEPGALVARGYTSGVEVVASTVETTGEPAGISLTAHRDRISSDPQDAVVVMASIVDDKERAVPQACNEVHFDAGEDGVVLGVGNGDPADHDPDTASSRRAFNGRCMAVVAPTDSGRAIDVRATSPGLGAVTVTVELTAAR